MLTDLADEKNLCLIGLWAYNPPAILTAVKDKDKLGKVKIVGFDENDVTLRGVADGHIHGTVVQNPFEFGYESVKLMAQIWLKGDRSGLPANGIRVCAAPRHHQGRRQGPRRGGQVQGRPERHSREEVSNGPRSCYTG